MRESLFIHSELEIEPNTKLYHQKQKDIKVRRENVVTTTKEKGVMMIHLIEKMLRKRIDKRVRTKIDQRKGRDHINLQIFLPNLETPCLLILDLILLENQ
jgi:hypothetical protein